MPYNTQKREQGVNFDCFHGLSWLTIKISVFISYDPFDLTQKKVAVTLGHRKQLLGLVE